MREGREKEEREEESKRGREEVRERGGGREKKIKEKAIHSQRH